MPNFALLSATFRATTDPWGVETFVSSFFHRISLTCFTLLEAFCGALIDP